MGFFDSARDFFLNGITSSLKKEYSPFLSAALLFMPDFKINKLNDGSKFGEIETVNDNFKIKLSFEYNPKKIDELYTQIFHYIDNEMMSSVQLIKSINEFISYEEYKKIRNISNQSYNNISNVMGPDWLVNHYLELKSKRSYIRYLLEPKNIEKIEQYKKVINSEKNDIRKTINNLRLRDSQLTTQYFFDSHFKGVDALKRREIAQGYTLDAYNRIIEQGNYKHCGKYKIMDVWYLKLLVYSGEDVVFEDIQLVNGLGNYNLHEDDFLFFTDAMDSMFKRWDNVKKN